jgi:hypothetical protein
MTPTAVDDEINMQVVCQYNNPPDMIVWHEKPFIKVSVLKY